MIIPPIHCRLQYIIWFWQIKHKICTLQKLLYLPILSHVKQKRSFYEITAHWKGFAFLDTAKPTIYEYKRQRVKNAAEQKKEYGK